MTFEEKLLKVARKFVSRNAIMEVHSNCVFVKQVDDSWSMYMPRRYASNQPDKLTYDLSKGIFFICSNIQTIIHLDAGDKEILLLKIKTGENSGRWTFICPMEFSQNLDLDIAKERFENSYVIEFDGPTQVTILNEFSYLRGAFHNSCYMVRIDGRNYFVYDYIRMLDNEKGHPGMKIVEFDEVVPLQKCYNEFKAKKEPGDKFAIYNTALQVKFGPSDIIEEVPDTEYEPIKGHVAYYSKNVQNNITGISVISDHYGAPNFSYKILFEKPAKNIKFLKRIPIKKSETQISKVVLDVAVVELWGITYTDGQKEIINTIIGKNFYNDGCIQYQIDFSNCEF